MNIQPKNQWLLLLFLCVASHADIRIGAPLRFQLRVRGGSSPHSSSGDSPRSTLYVLNPDYQAPRPVSLGDLEDEKGDAPYFPSQRRSVTNFGIDTTESSLGPNNILPPILQYLKQLQSDSPSLYGSLLSSVCIFVAWQIPAFQSFLGKNFVCSRRNLRAGRLLTVISACISHAGPMHLLFNMMALLSFGRQVNQVFQSSCRWRLWPLMVGSGLAGSLSYLLLDRHQGGCMGLSGVTLSFMALSSRFYPKGTVRFFLGPIPVQMTAEQALLYLLIASVVGTVVPNRSGIAHAAHLGGLLFGCFYYELWLRRRQLPLSLRRML